ncbi:unnamed protein product [Closterium sp. Naga37s-1]|nr:unnamed protein product [Closterium sp. Naga37s-1]
MGKLKRRIMPEDIVINIRCAFLLSLAAHGEAEAADNAEGIVIHAASSPCPFPPLTRLYPSTCPLHYPPGQMGKLKRRIMPEVIVINMVPFPLPPPAPLLPPPCLPLQMGKLKRRIMPEDIVINIGKEAPVPECPIPGHRWKEVRHDNTVTWLAYWFDPINQKDFKYVFLAPSSRLKGLSDKEKYEKARKLKDHIGKIRATYTKHFTSKDDQIRQVAVATYLIDRLALRAGNEKDDDEADTVGCCSLKVEHVTLVPPSSLQFDFLGKDSIRYFNTVEVEPLVYKAIGTFRKGKKKDEDLFDKLDTTRLNSHLKEIMPGLTAKVFRTYNASVTLDTLLQDTVGSLVVEKVADYQRANKEVAILCNHQRAVSKAHSAQMEKMQAKLKELEDAVEEMEEDLDRAQKGRPPVKREGEGARKVNPEALEKKLAQSKARLEKMKLDMSIKDELKTVALGTSKINYMDPRITIAWCKRHEVPIEKIFNKSLLAKFGWAMDVSPDFRF